LGFLFDPYTVPKKRALDLRKRGEIGQKRVSEKYRLKKVKRGSG